jgi:HCOMODA/2-hydroxy-3-carboxy-muconic semialdehyde decarboxylase
MQAVIESLQHLVIANRILAHEGVVDAFGHVSVRHPDHADRFLLARSRSPELVTMDDVLEFGLDGEPLDPDGPATYAERYIHAAIFEARPDVNSVIHNHAQELIPFTVTGVKLRPMSNTAGRIGAEIPLWDIRDKFGDTNLLVVNIEQGRDLATALDDKRMVLMRGHGCAIGAPDLHAAVTTAIYAQMNARLQMQAMQMGEVTYLSPGEIELMASSQHSATVGRDRSWEYLKNRAGCEHM